MRRRWFWYRRRIMKVDGKVIYEAKGLRVGLFTDAPRALPPNQRPPPPDKPGSHPSTSSG